MIIYERLTMTSRELITRTTEIIVRTVKPIIWVCTKMTTSKAIFLTYTSIRIYKHFYDVVFNSLIFSWQTFYEIIVIVVQNVFRVK